MWLVLYEYGSEYIITHRLTFPASYTLDEVKERTKARIFSLAGKTEWRATYAKLVEEVVYDTRSTKEN